MSTLRTRMEALVGTTSRQEAAEEGAEVEIDLKLLAPQLALAMQTMGLAMDDDEQLDAFLKTLKVAATTKSALLKQAIRRWNPSRATKAVKAAKAAL
jgi:hypothetical protein